MNVEDAIRQLDFPPDRDISDAAAKATEIIKSYIYAVREKHTFEAIEQENKVLEVIYKRFFDSADAWATHVQQQHSAADDHENAQALKQTAQKAVWDIQRSIVRFARIYMHIGRCVGVVNEEIGKHERTMGASEQFQWTSDTGELLKRYQREREELKTYKTRLGEGLDVLNKADAEYESLRMAACKIVGEKAADSILRSLRSNLRDGQYGSARKTLLRFAQEKKKFSLDRKGQANAYDNIKKAGETYIWMIENNDDLLENREQKLFLSTAEINVTVQSLDKELAQKEAFIFKYHGPYMNAKKKTLQKLRDKMLVFGSLEGLMTLYMKLVRGLAEPLRDIKDVRQFESEVIEHINFILKGQFQEIENIERRITETMDEFFQAIGRFKVFVAEQEEKVA